jgi:hypothetical protein
VLSSRGFQETERRIGIITVVYGLALWCICVRCAGWIMAGSSSSSALGIQEAIRAIPVVPLVGPALARKENHDCLGGLERGNGDGGPTHSDANFAVSCSIAMR